ncbi:DUF6438 domain-containing protein [Tundrisphaera sp. TA3]|uniref:DUF6438 domain-containing protein n=1 Tax=Tundrisphaera sp. TA3 TaxID=3435775 RepID=UPI003EBB9DBD
MQALLLLALALTAADEPIAEITLERTPCFGTCPVDVIVLRSDGTAEYLGEEYVERHGKYRGKVSKEDFDRLARLLAEVKFFDLKEAYTAPISDLPTYITSVKRGKATKKVSNYADAAPKGLGEVEKEIVKVMEKIAWTKLK